MQPALTASERIVYQTRLTQAEQSYHDLITGKAVEQFVDQNGEQVRYTKATVAGLQSYIASLRSALNPVFAAYNRKRPIGFTF